MAFTVCSPGCQMTPRLCGLEQQQSFILSLFAMQMNSGGQAPLCYLFCKFLSWPFPLTDKPILHLVAVSGDIGQDLDFPHNGSPPLPVLSNAMEAEFHQQVSQSVFPVIHLYAHKTAHQTFCWSLRGSLALEANLLKSQNIRIKCTSLGNPKNAQIAFICHSSTFLIFSVVFNILVCFNNSEMHRRQGTVFYYNHVWHN